MPRCIITGELITQENNSRAHIIPSALGGRLKPWDILSRDGNGLLGDKVDLPLIRAFQALMSLLNGSRDRGENQPVQMVDDNGRSYIVGFGDPVKLTKPRYEEKAAEDSVQIEIDARNLKELKTLLGRVKSKYPEFDIDEALSQAVNVRTWPDGALKEQLQIGPSVVFPALFVSASLFAVHHKQQAHPLLEDYVSQFDPEQPKMPPDTFYFIPSDEWISSPAEVSHIVAIMGCAKGQRALVYFELFNAVSVGVLLPYSGQSNICETYAVDVLSGREIVPVIEKSVIFGLPWEATHQLGDPDLYEITANRIGRLLQISQERAWDARIEALKADIFSFDDELPLTPEEMANGVGKLADFVLLEWQRPLMTVEMMKADMETFSELCSHLLSGIPASGRGAFQSLTQPYQQKLADHLNNKRRNNAGQASTCNVTPCNN